VLDPFSGTGSTGEVALKLGRHFIGIELYESYAQIAGGRRHQAHRLRNDYEAENDGHQNHLGIIVLEQRRQSKNSFNSTCP
jgi:DNA modification methylase